MKIEIKKKLAYVVLSFVALIPAILICIDGYLKNMLKEAVVASFSIYLIAALIVLGISWSIKVLTDER